MSFHLTSRRSKAISAFLGTILAFDAAYAASTWTVGLTSGTKGDGTAHSTTTAPITIDAVTSASPTNELFPGGTGDVLLKITNPNPFPVTIEALNLPASSSNAAGYTDAALSTSNSNCDNTKSLVTWTGSTTTAGTSHNLTPNVTIAAASGGTASVTTLTLTGAATMALGSPIACESTYFAMPPLTGDTAYADSPTATTGPSSTSLS